MKTNYLNIARNFPNFFSTFSIQLFFPKLHSTLRVFSKLLWNLLFLKKVVTGWNNAVIALAFTYVVCVVQLSVIVESGPVFSSVYSIRF
jgi:hypothetical protein